MPVGAVTSMMGASAQRKAADQAAGKQYESSMEALKLQKQMYDEQKGFLMPYMDAGTKALTGMQNADFQRDFTGSDFKKDPGYEFRLSEGAKALERSASAKGAAMGGAQLKALSRYNQDFATNEYGNAYDRFNNDRNLRFGRLSNIAGMGQNSVGILSGAGQNYANQGAGLWTGLGNAQAGSALAKGQATANMYGGINASYEKSQDNFFKMAGMAGGMMSDERVKKDISDASDELYEFLDSLSAFKYVYKNPERHGHGVRYSPMAQELEKTKVGSSMVVETPDGKAVNYGAAFGAMLAANITLHERIKKLEAERARS